MSIRSVDSPSGRPFVLYLQDLSEDSPFRPPPCGTFLAMGRLHRIFLLPMATCTTRLVSSWRTLRVGTMSYRNTRNLTNHRNGLNLGVSTKFDVALSVNAMTAPPHAVRHAHPQALQMRCLGAQTRAQSRPISRDWLIRGSWPTDRTVANALRMPVRMERSTARLPLADSPSSKRADTFAKRSDAGGRDRRFEPRLGRSIARREPFWPLP